MLCSGRDLSAPTRRSSLAAVFFFGCFIASVKKEQVPVAIGMPQVIMSRCNPNHLEYDGSEKAEA